MHPNVSVLTQLWIFTRKAMPLVTDILAYTVLQTQAQCNLQSQQSQVSVTLHASRSLSSYRKGSSSSFFLCLLLLTQPTRLINCIQSTLTVSEHEARQELSILHFIFLLHSHNSAHYFLGSVCIVADIPLLSPPSACRIQNRTDKYKR